MANQDLQYGNFATVIGRVQDKSIQEVNGKPILGKLTLNVGDSNQAYVDLWNPKRAETNHVESFFNEIDQGERIQLSGELEEQYYDGKYQRRVRAFVSTNKGVKYWNTNKDEKYVVALMGDVMDYDLRYENMERFDEDNIAVGSVKLATFNFYNPETGEEDKEVIDVIKESMEYHKEKMLNKDEMNDQAVKSLNSGIQKLEGADRKTAFKVLNKFHKDFKPRLNNITILHLVSYGELAEELTGQIDELAHVELGVQVNNYQEVDEYGFTNGYVNEAEIKKIREVQFVDDVPFDSNDNSGW